MTGDQNEGQLPGGAITVMAHLRFTGVYEGGCVVFFNLTLFMCDPVFRRITDKPRTMKI